MKRNMALVRAILEAVEATPRLQRPNLEKAIADDDPIIVDAHVALLVDASFLLVDTARAIGTPRQATIRRLTWQGYEYLEALRNPPIVGELLEAPSPPSPAEITRAVVRHLAAAKRTMLGTNATRADALERI